MCFSHGLSKLKVLLLSNEYRVLECYCFKLLILFGKRSNNNFRNILSNNLI